MAFQQKWRCETTRKLCKLLRLQRRPWLRSTEHAYEKAGLTVRNEPIAWNAEAVIVEVVLDVPHRRSWPKSEFSLHLDDPSFLEPDSLQMGSDGTLTLIYRLPTLHAATEGELCWRYQPLGRVRLPYLSQQMFLRQLRLESPTLLAQLGQHHVPCQAVVGSQCHGLLAHAQLVSPTSLLPLIDLDLRVTGTHHSSSYFREIPLSLTRHQLLSRTALLSANLRESPPCDGTWSLQWSLGDCVLVRNTLSTLSVLDFQQSVYVVDARYAFENRQGQRFYSPYLPPRESIHRVGPCFRLASLEAGAAGLCPLDLRVHYKDPAQPPLLVRQEVLLTDGPAPLVPLLLTTDEFAEVASFELLARKQTLGTLPGCCRPIVTFTSEGGFREPPDFDWTPVAEQELSVRLGRLLALPET